MTVRNDEVSGPGARIKVFGIGGGGTNAVSTMIRAQIDGVDFISANTDIQSLQAALAPRKIQIGKDLTKGLGAGADPDIGRDAALEDRQEILECVTGADMVFVTAGMGGGTGTGGAAIVAQIARESGALTVGVVTKPFGFEGKRRRKHAEIGIERLKEHVDTLLVIPNNRLLEVSGPSLTMLEAFRLADTVLVNAVRGISDIINVPGTINVDFADVKTVMSNMGQALMGIGSASGDDRARVAAGEAISSPLLEDVDIEGATGLLINITAGETVSLSEINEACTIIEEAAHDEANIIFGAVIDPSLEDEIRITVIATGFPLSTDEEYVIARKGAEQGDTISRSVSYHELAKKQDAAPKNLNVYDQMLNEQKQPSEVQEKPASVNGGALGSQALQNPAAASSNASFEEDELTKWTLSQLEEEAVSNEDKLADVEKALKVTAPTTEPPLFEPAPESFPVERELDLSSSAAVESSLTQPGRVELNPEVGKKIDQPDGRYEDFFTQVHEEVVSDLDRRIDEALKLEPDEKKEENKKDSSRRVEVPSFLRSGGPSFDLS